jgi:HD-like signal output (HDOD) protein
LTAGLLHDCGKLVFAANMPEDYTAVIEAARHPGATIYEEERNAFGADHAEVGAYLLGIWGIPDVIVEAVAVHHDLGSFPTKSCTASTAVHVADAFSNDKTGSSIDVSYLIASGIEDRLPEWLDIMKTCLAKTDDR